MYWLKMENDLTDLWNDLVDGLVELEEDFKKSNNKRGLRHLRSVRFTVSEIDNILKELAKKKGMFK